MWAYRVDFRSAPRKRKEEKGQEGKSRGMWDALAGPADERARLLGRLKRGWPPTDKLAMGDRWETKDHPHLPPPTPA